MIALEELSKLDKHLIYQTQSDGQLLSVFENETYRWFTLDGDAVQSIMCKVDPASLLLPVPQAMLLSLLWQSPNSVLNLGLGGAAFERFLSQRQIKQLVAVECFSAIIDNATRYFNLPSHINVCHQDAECYLNTCTETFDLILCDLFYKELNPRFFRSEHFFKSLSTCSSSRSVIAINLYVTDEISLLSYLQDAANYFSHQAMINFTDYKNIVLLLSHHAIPDKIQLQTLDATVKIEGIDFKPIINNLKRLQK